MANGNEKIEEVAAKAGELPETAETNAPKTSRAFTPRWVRACVSKSLASSEEKDKASGRSAADKTPWRRTRRK